MAFVKLAHSLSLTCQNSLMPITDSEMLHYNSILHNKCGKCYVTHEAKPSADDLDSVVRIWNTHKMRGTRNRRLPIGRPLLMFQAPTLFGVENRLIRIPERTIDCLENECTFYCEPCSDDIMQLCRNVISENNLLLNETITNPYDAVRLYIEIRTIIYQLLQSS
ncbi:hypothetical protein NQ315_005658 [Exocentrus adspersus]|uniref:Uncharacterized protein n=1 Tax=Exocentrus adspersus TaxID=1586481 RepID=A0AAV8V6V8_9CUCU|nr:hypothetical protein NQ315_005658 [Exocentrus adspersus]